MNNDLPGRTPRLMVIAPSMEMGALGRLAVTLLSSIDRQQIEPELAIVFQRDEFYKVPGDVRIHVIEKRQAPEQISLSLGLPNHLAKYDGDFYWLELTAFKTAALINEREPSVVFAMDWFTSIILLLAKRYIPRTVRIIVRPHLNYKLLRDSFFGELYLYVIQQLIDQAHYVLAHSRGRAHELTHVFGVQPERIVALNNPFDFERVRRLAHEEITEHPWFHENTPIALYVGRLAAEKGLDYLIRALSVLRGATTIRGVFIGDGGERETLQRLVNNLEMDDCILFLGARQNPFKYMKRATLFVLPSLSESFGNVLVEALACGCPIVAASGAEDGPAEILQGGQYGILVPPKHVEALSDAIMRLSSDGDLRQRYAELGILRAKEFDLQSSLGSYETLFLKNRPDDLQARQAEHELFAECRKRMDTQRHRGNMASGAPTPAQKSAAAIRFCNRHAAWKLREVVARWRRRMRLG